MKKKISVPTELIGQVFNIFNNCFSIKAFLIEKIPNLFENTDVSHGTQYFLSNVRYTNFFTKKFYKILK